MNTHDIFYPAITEMENNNSNLYGPEVFQKYIKKYNLSPKLTAQAISVDTLEALSPCLKAAKIMVFRLGVAENGRNTRFALVKAKNLEEFFIFNSKAFTQTIGQTYLPKTSFRDLFAFKVLPSLSESSYINLGLSSGLLNCALGLTSESTNLNPATGHSTYTFYIRLHSQIEQVFTHNKGQVEIDSIFLGQRDERDVLFVVEGKVGINTTIAKHKLIYSVLAIANKVPSDIEIVPVYVQVQNLPDGIHYNRSSLFLCVK